MEQTQGRTRTRHQALPEHVVTRLDSAVRMTDEGPWTCEGVITGRVGELHRWTRGSEEIRIDTTVFDTAAEAQAHLAFFHVSARLPEASIRRVAAAAGRELVRQR